MPSARPLVRQTAVHQQLVKEGASLTDLSGWLVAEHFGDTLEEARAVRSAVGLCDLSSVEKWEIKGNEISRHLASVFGPEIPEPGNAAPSIRGILCRVSRYHALFIADRHESLVSSILNASPARICAHTTDRTSGLADLLLCGPSARDVLGKLTSLDLRESRFPNHCCKSGPMAAIPVLLVRKDRGQLPGYEILFSREYGEYLWETLREAGKAYGLRPFGLAALKVLEQ